MSYFSVGYWVGKKYVRTRLKTHIVRNSKPVCGVKIGENKKFQFNASGIVMKYVECKKCKEWIQGHRFAHIVQKELRENTL